MIRNETANKILSRAYPEAVVSLEGIKRASESMTSHDVFKIDIQLNGTPAKIILKAIPEKTRSPKRYNLPREVAIMKSFGDYRRIRIPRVVYSDFSKEVLDREFFLMEFVQGSSMAELISAESREGRLHQVREIAYVMADIHATELARFPFLPQGDFGEYFLRETERINESIQERFKEYKPEREMSLLREVINKLRKEKPRLTDLALINGDIAPSHILKENGEWCVLDWDPAMLGDRSWDIYWFIKGVPEWVLGLEDGTSRLKNIYEEYSRRPLINSKYYAVGAVAHAYVYGVYILQNDPTHPHIDVVPEMTSRMVKQLEAYVR